jgi:SWI/SNF-related matrix-associated actin-dependent regulator of chromatin subfamily A member 5
MLKSITNYDIIVTTYEMVKNTQIRSLISTTYFHYVVLDEGHIIKDNTTFVSNAVRKIHSRYRLLLTGTPLQNNLVELYSILNYLYDDLFTEDLFFRDAFDISKNTIDRDMLLKANKLLNLFMLRRLKIEVEKLMPKKIETKVSFNFVFVILLFGCTVQFFFYWPE